mmetsp:Transcript_7552/g.23562  ORF Transcript_7552/g.23562 Transcript_7552/m.23562 type:complete len:201 (-) Transcript_7552:16-618(-)
MVSCWRLLVAKPFSSFCSPGLRDGSAGVELLITATGSARHATSRRNNFVVPRPFSVPALSVKRAESSSAAKSAARRVRSSRSRATTMTGAPWRKCVQWCDSRCASSDKGPPGAYRYRLRPSLVRVVMAIVEMSTADSSNAMLRARVPRQNARRSISPGELASMPAASSASRCVIASARASRTVSGFPDPPGIWRGGFAGQ